MSNQDPWSKEDAEAHVRANLVSNTRRVHWVGYWLYHRYTDPELAGWRHVFQLVGSDITGHGIADGMYLALFWEEGKGTRPSSWRSAIWTKDGLITHHRKGEDLEVLALAAGSLVQNPACP